MPTFTAEVASIEGKRFKTKIKAPSAEEARNFLLQRYVSIEKLQKSGLELPEFEFSFGGVSVKEKAVFSRQFSVMINAGVAIVRCLGVLADQCSNKKLKKALLAISADVQQGVSLSDALIKHPECFDQLYVSMVEAGETGGVLDEVLNRLAKLLEDIAKLQNQIKSSMAYPVTVGIFAVVVFFAMTIFLVPIFAAIFEDLEVPLPLITKAMLAISAVLRSWLVLIPIAVVAALVFLIKQIYKTPVGRRKIDSFFLKMPLFGPLNEKSAVARFCRVFGTLTRSGVPVLNCLEIVTSTISNKIIADAVEAAQEEIKQGGMISLALQEKKVFPPLAIQMISIGEETGELDAMMMKVADFYEDEVEQAVKALTSIIEPLMMVMIAGMVGTILLSMYMPMFAIFDGLA